MQACEAVLRYGVQFSTSRAYVAAPLYAELERLLSEMAAGAPVVLAATASLAHLGALPVLGSAGAFGENLSTAGLTEADLCLADRLRIGTALFEVSQARQPCWKLNERFGVPGMARRVQETRRTGWYLRVVEPGSVGAGDEIVLVERPYPDWTLHRLMVLLYGAPQEPAVVREALALPLVPSWRALLERRLATGRIEDWTSRLEGPG